MHSKFNDENIWKNDFNGSVLYSLGTSSIMQCPYCLFWKFNFSVNKQVGDKTGRILILDINIDEIRYVLINIYNANTKVGQVQLL